jgi:site-specific recombinase XerC
MFFRDTAAWEWPDVPGRPLLGVGDRPKTPCHVPRFIPADELERLMTAIADLECPQQRAALLVARWCGARQGEIRRLAVDCLDRTPTSRRDYASRPGRPTASGSCRSTTKPPKRCEVIALRAAGGERAFTDELTGNDTRYLFMSHGKLLSTAYLFQRPLARACAQANLVDAAGRPTVSSHRFRHTVGTQLAERGARLQTIMSVLGHRSVSMSLVYAQISDPEVLRDYQAVLGPGATIAGPCAAALKAGELPNSDRLAEDQLLQDRTRAWPLPAPPQRRPLRVRPLPDLRQVRHDTRLRPEASHPSQDRAAPRRRRRTARLATRSRPPPLHRSAPRAPPRRARRTDRPSSQMTPPTLDTANCPHNAVAGGVGAVDADRQLAAVIQDAVQGVGGVSDRWFGSRGSRNACADRTRKASQVPGRGVGVRCSSRR